MTTIEPITHSQKDPQYRQPVSLWAGVIGAPLLWIFQLQLQYTLVPWVCRSHHVWVLHAITIACVIVCAIAFTLCWCERQKVPVPGGTKDNEIGAIGRRHFMSVLGMFSSALFATVILAQGIAS